MGWSDRDLSGRLYNGERQAPLSLRFEPRQQWPVLRGAFGVSEAGAAIILALLAEFRGAGRPISYSRTAGHYAIPERYRSRLYGLRQIVGSVDHLVQRDALFHDKAFAGRRGWQSAIMARPEFAAEVDEVLAGAPKLVLARPPELVILRDANGDPVDYDDRAMHHRMRRNLETMNEAIGAADISDSMSAPMVRIFNRSMDRCGRIFAQGGAWQSVKSEARRQIQIGGEPVVEVDFKTMHPAILYARLGLPLPRDAYAIGHWPRKLVKVAVLILVNAGTRHEARMAIAHRDAMAPIAEPGSQEALDAADRLIADIKVAHCPIARWFHSDAGAELMRIDGDIAEAVIMMMLAQGIVVLPVHDSFLVPASKVAALEKAMTRAAHEAGLPSLQRERKQGAA